MNAVKDAVVIAFLFAVIVIGGLVFALLVYAAFGVKVL